MAASPPKKRKTAKSEVALNAKIAQEKRQVLPQLDSGQLQTQIDQLLSHVMQNKQVKITDAAKKFGVPVSKMEEWGQILEEHKMLELHYPAFGKPMLRVPDKPKSPKAVMVKSENAGAKKHAGIAKLHPSERMKGKSVSKFGFLIALALLLVLYMTGLLKF